MMRRFVFIAVACVGLAGPLRAQSSTFLELGKPSEREIRGGEKDSYKIHAEAGQFVGVFAFAIGIDD